MIQIARVGGLPVNHSVRVRLSPIPVVIAVVGLVACGGSHTRSSHVSDHLIVLDRSIGPARLKEPRAKIERDLGKGTLLSSKVESSSDPEPVREERVAYEGGDLIVIYISGSHHAPIAFVLETASPLYRLKNGIGVGSSLARLRKLGGVECYGTTTCQRIEGHNKPGTLFRLTRPGGRVARIFVVLSVD